MLEETRSAIIRSGHTYALIARKSGLAFNTIKGVMEKDANPTIKTLEAITQGIASLPNKAGRTCDGCAFNEGPMPEDGDGIICVITGSMREPVGCAMRCARS